MLLLLAAVGWTIIGSVIHSPGIFYSPTAARLLPVYFIGLGIPMLLILPVSTYLAIEAEIEDGTLELLTITTMSPWQIVSGKVGTSLLQMMLYFVCLLPCLAYAYTLRGVTLATIVAAVVDSENAAA